MTVKNDVTNTNEGNNTENVELDLNEQILQRKEKLKALQGKGNAYPNDFKRQDFAKDIFDKHNSKEKAVLEKESNEVIIAGRIMTRRLMGKASFVHIQDMTGRIQVYVRKNDIPEGVYDEFKTWDLGDIVGIKGTVFKTKTQELSIKATSIQILTKSLRPLPDKWHGLQDLEVRYRQRYLDLIVNEKSREVFLKRTKIIQIMRDFFIEKGFIDVETPMMQVIPGGAAARPFITHHNALDMDLYLRIAPELYLKRLVVGGFEKVFEINRNFRNEGLSTRHNPEFTMIEFYQAYADYKDLMNLTEELFQKIAIALHSEFKSDIDPQSDSSLVFEYQGAKIDYSKPFARYTIKESILEYNKDITKEDLEDKDKITSIIIAKDGAVDKNWGLGKLQLELFELTVEEKLIQPTFITEFATEVSPLARTSDTDPDYTDRFELFIAGKEIANGFSELNDPIDQAMRFKKQVEDKEAGDLEAMHYDADYIRALEYGLPPTAGEGIGIDRLVMLFTDCTSIRDVLLFPHMRHE